LVDPLVLVLIDGSEADGLGCPTTQRTKETVLNVTKRDRQCKKQGWWWWCSKYRLWGCLL